MDDKEIVSALRAHLADKVGRERFDLWLGEKVRLDLHGSTLSIELPSRFAQDWVRSHFRREIEEAAAEVVGKAVAIEFRVDETLARSAESNRAARRNRACDRAADFSANDDSAVAVAESPADALGAPADGEVNRTPRAAGRNGVDDSPSASRRRFAALDSFIVGKSNRFAHTAAQMAAEQPGRFSPLFVYGPTGVGKTHLLEGIWTSARRHNPRVQAVYLSAEQFTTYFLEALHGSGLPNFRRKYRGVELLIIDDVQFFAGKRATIGELLYTTDTLLRQGSQLVLSADRAPTALHELSDELTARLASGMSCGIERPDFQTRLGILQQFAAGIGFELADGVAEFIATQLTSHARELCGALNRLEAAGRVWRQPITRALAEEALAEMIRHNPRGVRLADIDKAVCDVFGLSPEELQSGRRAKSVSQPRMLAMWLARKHTRSALAEIGEHFGRRSHSTVISAQKTVNGWVAKQSKIELTGKTWSVEEAIRRVEDEFKSA
ncbi:MAG TPA: chromosomal replication initiator protein DnaA [Pirellulales bacterium]|jgi:chromosomal replication initiator protein|nr:chromosomal replication initiator protein DnaA [Pirellulales bacterium]